MDIIPLKDQPPLNVNNALHRQRLIDSMSGENNTPLTFLHASAGCGKSVLMAQLFNMLARDNKSVFWLSLDRSNDRFDLLINAIAQICDIELEATPQTVDQLSDCFLGINLEHIEPVTLFVDNLENVLDDNALAILTNVFKWLPKFINLVISSHRLTRKMLIFWRLDEQVNLVTANELRFTESETNEYYQLRDLKDLSLQQTLQIYSITEGWPVGIQIAYLILSDSEQTISDERLARDITSQAQAYFLENVMHNLPDSIQEFLRTCGFLRILKLDLCRSLCADIDNEETIRFLESQRIFFHTLDANSPSYRFHHLFSAFVSEQFQKSWSADKKEVLIKRAIQWCLKNNQYDDAVEYSLLLDDDDYLTQVLNQSAHSLVQNGQLTLLSNIAQKLPIESLKANPKILSAAIWASSFLKDTQSTGRFYSILESAAKANPKDTYIQDCVIVLKVMQAFHGDDLEWLSENIDSFFGKLHHHDTFEYAAFANAYGYYLLCHNEFHRADETINLALGVCEKSESLFGGAYSLSLLVMHKMISANPIEAVALFNSSMMQNKRDYSLWYKGCVAVTAMIVADGYYELNRLEDLEFMLANYLEHAADETFIDWYATGLVLRVRLFCARAQYKEAEKALDEATRTIPILKVERFKRIIRREYLRLAILQNDTQRANEIGQLLYGEQAQINTNDWKMYISELEENSLSKARWLVFVGQLKEAKSLIRTALRNNSQTRRIRRVIKLNILLASAYDIEDDHLMAMRTIQEALKLAAPGGMVRPFIDEGDRVIRLVKKNYSNIVNKTQQATDLPIEFFIKILKPVKQHEVELIPKSLDEDDLKVELTAREHEILKLISMGYTNPDLVDHLFLSNNTIKWHVKNIFSKLRVSNRVQAAVVAKKKGLL